MWAASLLCGGPARCRTSTTEGKEEGKRSLLLTRNWTQVWKKNGLGVLVLTDTRNKNWLRGQSLGAGESSRYRSLPPPGTLNQRKNCDVQGPSSKLGPDTWTGWSRNPPLDPCGEWRSRALSRACSVCITEWKLLPTHPSLLSK